MIAAALEFSTDTTHIPVASRVMGDIAVRARDVYDFTGGIFGFPDATRFAVLPTARDGLFWLQSVELGSLAFLLVDPFRFFEGFVLDVTPADCVRLRTDDAAAVHVYAIVTLPESGDDVPTANLQGPIVLDVVNRRGIQTVVPDGTYTTREPLRIARAG